MNFDAEKKTFSNDPGEYGDVAIFGDEKSSKVLPCVEIKRWNGENTLGIKSKKNYDADHLVVGSEVRIEDSKDYFYFNTPDPSIVKFGLVFKEKPNTNKFSFDLDGWQDFDFHYQRPLDNENEDGSTWEPNDPKQYEIDGTGGISTRPVDVNGSYAVYHKTKRDGDVYKTGKFCHIYRPRFIDSNGEFTWGELNIDNGSYEVTIPQDFLDKATYPVRANDTIGITTVGATNDSGNLDVYHSAKNTAPSTNSYTTIKMACWYSGGGTNVKMAIYNDNAGTPANGSLVSNSSSGAKSVSQTTKPTVDSEWTSGTINASLTSSSIYWLAWCTDSNNTNIAKDDTQGTRASNSTGTSYASFPPGTHPGTGTGVTNGQTWSIYAATTATATFVPRLTLMGCG